ncbi:MAG: tetratricopeptide repeat protein [Pseudobacter sp.]|uniref:tetratricopeptide repeat-containing sensor histidine kinase n=1 Tax=Pseudobacter sp. TaxID=2045420 RepID=UPI003F7F70D9
MKNFLPFFFLVISLPAVSQEGRAFVDSLIKAVPGQTNDTAKARLYNRIFNELNYIDVNEAMSYARSGLAHATKMKWPKGIAVFHSNIGMAFSNAGNFDSARHYYESALKVHEQLGDKYNMAMTNNNMGTAAQNIRSDFSTAAQYYFKALQLAEELNDSTLLPLTLSNISRIHSLQKNYLKAEESATRALHIREKNGTPDAIAQSLEDIGKIHYQSGNHKAAASTFLKAQSIYEQSGNLMGLATIWSGLSLTYGNDHRKIIEARLKSKSLWDEVNPVHPEAITNTGNLGVAYLELVKFDSNHSVRYGDVIPDNKKQLLQKAETYLKSAVELAGQTGDMDNKSFFTGILAELQEQTGDYRNAFYNYRTFKEMEDSIYSQENKNKIAEAESLRAIEKKNSELRINQLALSNQRKTVWGLSAGVLLLSAIGILLYRQNKMRKRSNETLLQLNRELNNANKMKARFFGILSHDLRAPVVNLINFLHLRKEPGILSKDQEEKHEQKITSSAEALLENMESLLLWSKNQMDQFKPSPSEINIGDLYKYIDQQFQHSGVSIQFEGDQQIKLFTDENCIRTIMYNLTSNSLKAVSQQPDGQISWEAGIENNQVFICINDNGTGLDPELLMNDDLRASSATSVRSGLGLSIVKDLAKAIGCTIGIAPVSKGTCIRIILPQRI